MNIFAELLQVALGNRKELSKIPTKEEWTEVFDMAKKQTISGVLFDGVEKLPVEQRPEKTILLQWYAYVERLEKRNDKMNYFTRNVMMRFMMDGFKVLVLKGQGNAMMYPNPRRRHSGDIDVWLTIPGKTPREGRDEIVKYARQYTPHGQVLYHHTVFDVLEKSEGIEIEPHYMPTWLNNPFKNSILQKWFEDEVDKQFDKNKLILPNDVGFIYVPTREFNIIFQLIHIFRHLYSDGIGLRQIVDYYYLLHQEEHNIMPDMLKRLGLEMFTGSLMYVLETVCGMERKYMLCDPYEKGGQFLLNEIMMSGNFGLHDIRNPFDLEEGIWHRLYRRQKRILNFINFYPGEIVWGLYFTVWQRLWRIKKGYTGLFGR
jgi:hypothetical protein